MKQHVPVSTIMSKNIVKLNLTDDLSKAEALFKDHKIKHIPVMNQSEIIGMLSYADLLRVSYTEEMQEDETEGLESMVFNMFTIRQVMTKEVVTIKPYTTIKEAATILVAHDFHSLPVCDGTNLVGILTSTDLIAYFLEQYDLMDD